MSFPLAWRHALWSIDPLPSEFHTGKKLFFSFYFHFFSISITLVSGGCQAVENWKAPYFSKVFAHKVFFSQPIFFKLGKLKTEIGMAVACVLLKVRLYIFTAGGWKKIPLIVRCSKLIGSCGWFYNTPPHHPMTVLEFHLRHYFFPWFVFQCFTRFRRF